MIRKAFLVGLIIALACGWAVARAAETAEIRAIRFWSPTDSNRVVLELSRATSHRVFTLANPHRVVVDLVATRLAEDLREPAAQGLVTAVRTGVQPGRTARVVLELKSPVEPRAIWIEPAGESSHRLVIALDGEGMPAPGVAAAQPVRAAHAPAETNREVVVAVDAGHGGQDPGAIGRSGTREKDVVLAIARALARRIDSEPGMRAVLTRNEDQFLSLRERIRRARVAQADLFLSVHADAVRNRAVSGASVYVLSERGASSEAARWLAERENAADLMGGVSLDDKGSLASVLLDLSQSASISASMTAAERVLASLRRVGEVRKPQVQQAGFVVLKSPDIPSMLIETAYISNPGDERRLRTREHQNKLADAIFAGVRTYFEHNPPPGSRFARARHANAAGVLAAPATP